MGLIVLMLDGVSADTFARHRGRMPHLAALAERGTTVERLAAEVPATSLPGRTSILTGVSSDVSGVYGNMLWSGTRFRYAAPDDVRVPTLARSARAAGLRTASIGMGMVRPEDADVFQRPWWVGATLQRARDAQALTPEDAWWRVFEHRDESGALARAAAAMGVPADFDAPPSAETDRLLAGFLGDQRVADWVGALAGAPAAPDLILAEFLMTDTIQHRAGYGSDVALWALSVTDALVGDVVSHVRAAGREDAYDLAIVSDHGHGPVRRALRPDLLLPGMRFQSEGAVLHLAPRDGAEARRASAILGEYGCVPFGTGHLPTDRRDRLTAFLAPDGIAFEHDRTAPAAEPLTAPTHRSSHGARPGHPADERFLVLAGPSVGRARIGRARSDAVAPTLAALLGLPLRGYPGTPLTASRAVAA